MENVEKSIEMTSMENNTPGFKVFYLNIFTCSMVGPKRNIRNG